jgi:hypothetical protein
MRGYPSVPIESQGEFERLRGHKERKASGIIGELMRRFGLTN